MLNLLNRIISLTLLYVNDNCLRFSVKFSTMMLIYVDTIINDIAIGKEVE